MQQEICTRLRQILKESCARQAVIQKKSTFSYTRIADFLHHKLNLIGRGYRLDSVGIRIDKMLRLGSSGRRAPDEEILKLMAEAEFLWNSDEQRPYNEAEIVAIANGTVLPGPVEVLHVQLRMLQLTDAQKMMLADSLVSEILKTKNAQTFFQRLNSVIAENPEINLGNHHKIATSIVDEHSSTLVVAKEEMMAGSGLSQKGTDRLVQLYRHSLAKMGYQYDPVGAALSLNCPEQGSLGFTRDTLISVYESEIGSSWGPVLTNGDWYAIAQTCYAPSWWEGDKPILSKIRFGGDVSALKYALENSSHLC